MANSFRKHLKDKNYAEARRSLLERSSLVSIEKAAEFSAAIYDEEGRELIDREEWLKADEVYRAGLQEHPQDDLLTTNAPIVFADWAEKAIDKKEWSEAIRIYDLGLARFPDNGLFKQNKAYCEQERDRK